MIIPSLFAAVLLLLHHATSLPTGAPATVCQTMLPFHGGGIPPQESPTLYGIYPSVIQLAENTKLRVSLGSQQGIQFGGFMMQARLEYSGEPVGAFTKIPEDTKTLSCSGPNDTVTHANSANKGPLLEFDWMPPPGFRGKIIFNATVAQAYAKFWVGVVSETVQVMRGSDITNPIPTTVSRRPTSSTPPSFNPETPSEVISTSDPFYTDCYQTKGCFGAPEGCVKTQNCKVVVATTVKGDKYEFEMMSPDPNAKYIAHGLSDDDKMGDDSVVECVRNDNDEIRAYMSVNVPVGKNMERLPPSQHGIELKESSINNGKFYCKVSRDKRTSVNGKIFDLENNQYHLLVAAGKKELSFHTVAYLAAGEKRALSDVSEVAGASKLLLRLHGAFMLAAWVGTASVGILLARYYRQTWVGRSICGKDLWFAWHRFFMVLTWTLTMAAFIIIFVELKAWSSARNPHAILGTVTTIICFLQPIGAFFRPHPGTPKRPIFNWLHWLGGNVAHILAIVTIFFAVKLNKAELPEWLDWILVAFVAFHVLVHIVLSILGCVSDRAAESRVTSFPMKDLGSNGRTSHSFERSADAPKSGARKLILGLYLLVILLFVAAMIVIIVLAPIEDTWRNMMKKMSES